MLHTYFTKLYILFLLAYLLLSIPFLLAQNIDPLQELEQENQVFNKTLLVIPFQSKGITEMVSKEYANQLAQNMSNMNHFEIITPQELYDFLETEDSELIDCFQIGCGIQAGKRVNADYIVTGKISINPNTQRLLLQVNLIEVMTNQLKFKDQIYFTDENVDQNFYLLSKQISEHIPVIGKVLNATSVNAVISLGTEDGIQVGDQVIIYDDTIKSNLNERQFSQKKNIAILTIDHTGKRTSEGNYFQMIQLPLKTHKVQTFINRRKQIELMEHVRKELDAYARNQYESKKIQISSVPLIDEGRKEWVAKLRHWEEQRDFYQWFLVGSSVLTAYILTQTDDNGGLKTLASLGALGFSTFKFFQARNSVEDLINQGKYKGYIDLKVTPAETVSLQYHISF